MLGVILPVEFEGVTRPPAEGVILPLEKEPEGVRDPELRDGVAFPEFLELAGAPLCVPLRDATEEGRSTAPGPTVGCDSLVVATNTPHFSGQ